MKEIYNKIKEYRKKLNITQAYMSEKLGLTQPHYANLENGKFEISLEKLEKMSEVFNISVIELLGNNGGIGAVANNNKEIESLKKENEQLIKDNQELSKENEQLKNKITLLKEIKDLTENKLFNFIKILEELFSKYYLIDEGVLDSINFHFYQRSKGATTVNGKFTKEEEDEMSMEEFIMNIYIGEDDFSKDMIENFNLFNYNRDKNILILKILNAFQKQIIKRYVVFFQKELNHNEKYKMFQNRNWEDKDFEEYVDLYYRHEFPKARKEFEIEAMKKAYAIYQKEKNKKK